MSPVTDSAARVGEARWVYREQSPFALGVSAETSTAAAFFWRARRCLVVTAAPHTRMHTVVSPEVGAATLEIRRKEACKDEKGRKKGGPTRRAQLSDTVTERV